MANEKLLTALYKKMSAEQAQYRQWLLGQPPDEQRWRPVSRQRALRSHVGPNERGTALRQI